MEAAAALSRIGSCPEALAAVPRLIQVLADTDTDIPVRAKTLWALRAHQEKLKMFDDLFPALEKVLREPKREDMRLLRYDCAFILGVFQRDQVSAKVMETLNEFLHDDTIIIYTGTSVKGTGGSEAGVGTAAIQESGKGDGRVMAVDALRYIGAQKISQHPEIRRQLQAIANNPRTLPDLRMKARELLSEL
jgi:hypothetical protein